MKSEARRFGHVKMDTESTFSQPDSSNLRLLHDSQVEAMYEASLVPRTIKRLGSQRTPQILSWKTYCSQQWDQFSRRRAVQHMKWYLEMIFAGNKLGGPCRNSAMHRLRWWNCSWFEQSAEA